MFGLSIAALALGFLSSTAALGDAVPWERLEKNNSVLVILDLQVGLYNLVNDWDPQLYHNNIMAHSALGKVFDIPVIMSTSAETGPNGPLPDEILEMYPDAPLIKRNGEVNAWDNAEFREAIKATNRTQIIVAGIVTDVCTAFLALSLRAEGYSVYANIEASGTTSTFIRDESNRRMEKHGVNLYSFFAIVSDLMRDWRNTPGSKEVMPFLKKYYAVYGYVAKGHLAAVESGTILPGENETTTL